LVLAGFKFLFEPFTIPLSREACHDAWPFRPGVWRLLRANQGVEHLEVVKIGLLPLRGTGWGRFLLTIAIVQRKAVPTDSHHVVVTSVHDVLHLLVAEVQTCADFDAKKGVALFAPPFLRHAVISYP